ncbi:class F sortase [Demequina sp. NBRC 110051]|uniref:class F sortase n=1 Tax=Demequina sp. NBRC 110051 TaxID=1570340 RepID=UPI000A06E5A2|nr:class F sortase [Demequina sp. NBRC 110051]
MSPTRIGTAVAAIAVALAMGYVAVDAWRVEAPPAVVAGTSPHASVDERAVPEVTAGTPDAAPSVAAEPPVVVADAGIPSRLTVPAIGVDTSLEQLGLEADGALATPVDTDLAGWFEGGPRPGAVGPAVIAGHVSWNGDPSVFFRLGELVAGDRITVEGDNGTEATFAVTRVEQHAKDDFPTVSVYANTSSPELRLITCGGEFDRGTGHFDDNVIVFAELVETA